ncbi:MAG: hypothetical protein ABJF10_18350 [Chthoniobacter sp.]|uniref:hypothetical protein n=1 Tax=Chthoniobacter sp. TaxID=2510640 RepID=UPI0032A618DD
MNITRNGKIARLPYELREQLNQRLLDGESGRALLAWLNAQPATQAVLKAEFGGRSINGPNLTAWRQQGYREWRMEREARAVAQQIGRVATLETVDDPGVATETLAHWMAGRYAVATTRVEKAASPEEHWRLLREMCGDITRLRQGDHRVMRMDLERERAALSGERRELLAGRRERSEQSDPGAIPAEIAPNLPKNRTRPNFILQRRIKPD